MRVQCAANSLACSNIASASGFEEPVFVLPEASVVRMMEEHEVYVLIRIEAGRTGWAQRSNLAPIVPCTQAK
jgi:hypothetical protein